MVRIFMSFSVLHFYTLLATLIVPILLLSALTIAILRTRRYTPIIPPSEFAPHCAIILPCKGAHKDLATNITSFCNLTYPHYTLTLVVESNDDSAVPIIQECISNTPKAQLVVAGITTSCGQKNHNLIEAVKHTSDSEILIFADSDIKLSPSWIQDLIAPLSNESITVATGFRWLSPGTSHIGSLVHSFQNVVLYSFFSVSSWLMNVGVWGGSMAIRKKDYEALNIAQEWARTSVDDMSLSQILKKAKAQTSLVYTAITTTTDTLQHVSQTVAWYERQTMYLKAHQKTEWFLSMLIVGATLCTYALGVGGMLLLPFSPQEASILLLPFSVFLLLIMLAATLASLIKPLHFHYRFILAAPFSLFITVIAMARTLFTNTITWSGVRYTIAFKNGTVSHVSRGEKL